MRVDLLLILLLETEDHLHRDTRTWFDGDLLSLELQADLRSVLVDVSCHILTVHLLLRNSVLVHAQTSQHGPGTRVNLGAPVADDADDDLLPRLLAPRLAVCSRAHVLDVFEHANHGPGEEKLVFIVHSHCNKELSMPRLCKKFLTQGEALVVEIRRITCRRGIPHVREFIAARRLYVRHLVQ